MAVLGIKRALDNIWEPHWILLSFVLTTWAIKQRKHA